MPKKHSNRKLIKPEHYFILNSGGTIKDLTQLALNTDSIDDDDFCHHVTDDKNDFSMWINDIIKDKKLAEQVAKIKDKKDLQIALLKRVVKKR